MIKFAFSLIALFAALTLPLAGCDKTPESATSELSQQQPLKQKLAELIKKAEAGDAEAQVALGEAYAEGEGVAKDSQRAAVLFRQAAEKGIAKAQFRLGQMYARGDGVPQDEALASDLIKQSAANGYAKAQARLGAMYAKGEGVTKDEVLAYVWSALAVSQGEMEAKKTQDSVPLTVALHEEADRLKAKWKVGMALVREKEEAAIPAVPARRDAVNKK